MNRVFKNIRYIRITEETCRICLRETPMGKKVLRSFESQVDDVPDQLTLGQMFNICTGYEPQTGPMHICILCEASLKQLYLFRKEVDNAESLLKVFDISIPENHHKSIHISEHHEEIIDATHDEEIEVKMLDNEVELEQEFEEQENMNEVHVEMEDTEYDDHHEESLKEEHLEEEIVTEVACKIEHMNSKTCNYCSKTFTTVSHCEMHKKIHYGIKEYQCEECLKFFRTLSQLKSHMNCHHDNRNYQCNVCQKKFKTKKTLKGHEETHTTEISFFCKYCNQGYTNKTALRVHTLRRHRSIKQEEVRGEETIVV